ncbi:MAG: matrixin family metalloprotease, partial [Planctomycetales bacterium]|nr:matrixin family metalloprotease [Planctomycetales bacterium]
MARKYEPKPRNRRRLTLEQLQPRLTLDGTASAAGAYPWLNVGDLTYSFVPDGTRLANEESRLFEELSPTGSEQQWQGEFSAAFAEWLSSLGVQAQQVGDSGDEFGTYGPTQGDTRFGDIRIGAIPLATNVLAEAIPHSIVTQGTWAGDILLNSNANWETLQQVFSVALHEIGHVLGMQHSTDAASPMYYHGVYNAEHPTSKDIAAIKKLYSGVHIGNGDGDDSENHSSGDGDSIEGSDEWHESPDYQFNSNNSVLLIAEPGTARYVASGELTAENPIELFELASIGEIDHAEYLNIIVSSTGVGGLIPDIVLYDLSGDTLQTRTLHRVNGVVVLQAKGVEPSHRYYLAIKGSAGESRYQVGGFQLMAEYGLTALVPKVVGTAVLSDSVPLMEQEFEVTHSRLLHVHIESSIRKRITNNGEIAIWGFVVSADGRIIANWALAPGESRSAPIFFVEPGKYRVILQIGSQVDRSVPSTSIKISIDEISMDIGPGVIDPTLNPILTCDSPGADAQTCAPETPVILVGGPVYPDPTTPNYPTITPWLDPSWFY